MLNRKIKNEESGFSLIEIVIAMFVLGLIMPAVVQIGVGSIRTGNVASSNSKNILGAAGINSVLTNDIERASATKVEVGNKLQFKSANGNCISWKIENNQLLRAEMAGKISSNSNWIAISENVKTPTEEIFKISPNGFISYKFDLGDSDSSLNISGSSKQKVMNSGKGACW